MSVQTTTTNAQSGDTVNQHFQVGELARIEGALNEPKYNGTECTVVRPLAIRDMCRDSGTVFPCAVYVCEMSDGKVLMIPPNLLRKLFERSAWDKLCDEHGRSIWQPKARKRA